MSLKDQVVVITGASQGIGRAIAERCARDGAKLAICGRSPQPLKEVERALGATTDMVAVPADASREAEVERFKEEVLLRFGRVDAICNNAGSAKALPFLKSTRMDWEEMLAVNATSAFLVTRAFLPGMVERSAGRVVMIASSAAKRGAAYVSSYTAAKHAMLGLARSLAAEFAAKGIRVNSICPGYVDTPMTSRSVENIVKTTKRSADEARQALAGMNAQKRLIRPDEVAELAAKLLDPDCTQNGEAFDL